MELVGRFASSGAGTLDTFENRAYYGVGVGAGFTQVLDVTDGGAPIPTATLHTPAMLDPWEVAAQGRAWHGLTDDPVVAISAAMLVGGTSQAVLDGRAETSRDAFIDELVAVWLAIDHSAVRRIRDRS